MKPADLKQWRQEQGFTLQIAAKKLGCGARSLGAYERGESNIPRYIALAIRALEAGLEPKGGE